jgi:CheY-like chemotaxis protein
VIDDEAEIRRNLTIGLTSEEYGVTACPDGISAIHELNRARNEGLGYDYLVICDHSRSATYANGLDIPRLKEHIAAIPALEGLRQRIFARLAQDEDVEG